MKSIEFYISSLNKTIYCKLGKDIVKMIATMAFQMDLGQKHKIVEHSIWFSSVERDAEGLPDITFQQYALALFYESMSMFNPMNFLCRELNMASVVSGKGRLLEYSNHVITPPTLIQVLYDLLGVIPKSVQVVEQGYVIRAYNASYMVGLIIKYEDTGSIYFQLYDINWPTSISQFDTPGILQKVVLKASINLTKELYGYVADLEMWESIHTRLEQEMGSDFTPIELFF